MSSTRIWKVCLNHTKNIFFTQNTEALPIFLLATSKIFWPIIMDEKQNFLVTPSDNYLAFLCSYTTFSSRYFEI